ncbi:DUF488 domain-containing protein [Paenibacillus physcomitrellae]|uniref:DUF488 domain-containing protein n=1 Tax=Paenibacillus physcomitrellae TaxID=1619311 RepID=A0ABQ1FTL0_9BACL|nr:DUF488 domain-containing protein [Paenibacillus physcomitrellae]GGA30309.1 hypothetical protein GCM10010917_14300 [Paenibacillus physcomitrellae]
MSRIPADHLTIKRIYEPYGAADGCRILVDRLWPRGIAKEQAMIQEWMKDVAPSPGLRKWFGHEPERFEEFRDRYMLELDQEAVPRAAAAKIRDLAAQQKVTLIYAAKDPMHNHALVLRDWLKSLE